MRAASTSTPSAVIHSLVTSMIPSSSPTRSFLAIARPLCTSSIKTSAGILSAARMASVQPSGWGSDELERPVTDVEDALPAMPVQHSRCQDLANACIAASRVGS
jgi:hypothetical protein